MKPKEKFARILRIKEDKLMSVCDNMERICKNSGAMEKVIAENHHKVKEILSILGLTRDSKASEVYKAVISKLTSDDQRLNDILEEPKCSSKETCVKMITTAKDIADVGSGIFLKREVAIDMLQKSVPKSIMKALGYKTVDELVEKENLYEIYSALRFVESSEWMNEKLVPLYDNLKPEDFEEREIEVLVLDNKWLKIAEKFIKKKYHNVSHLKEMGVVFIIPLDVDTPGELLRVFTLILHYLHEVKFYNTLFKKYEHNGDIGKKIMSLIRGDVLEGDLPGDQKDKWRIVQRYLAKDDENDPRLFEPHVNPETLHWDKAENDLTRLDARFENMDFTFWKDLNFVGDFFKNSKGEELVSFNLIDSIMSLVKEKEMIKYLYHHQEALWNKIFSEFVGREKMEEMIIKNFEQGYIDLAKELNE